MLRKSEARLSACESAFPLFHSWQTDVEARPRIDVSGAKVERKWRGEIGPAAAARDASVKSDDQGRSSRPAEWKAGGENPPLPGGSGRRVSSTVACPAALRSVKPTDFNVAALHQTRRAHSVEARMEARWNWSHERNAPMKNKHVPQSPLPSPPAKTPPVGRFEVFLSNPNPQSTPSPNLGVAP